MRSISIPRGCARLGTESSWCYDPAAMTPVNDPADRAGMAGHLVVVIDAALPVAVQQASADAAAALAAQTGMPVTLATAPVARLDALRAGLGRDLDAQTREYAPPARPDPAEAMSSAPFVWREDGRPDWARMWTTFCELALYGGPPHRGPEQRAAGAERRGGRGSDAAMLAEMRRGIWETTGLYAESGAAGLARRHVRHRPRWPPGCARPSSSRMSTRGSTRIGLLVPAGPDYQLKDEVKSIITVVAKTHHYWQAHVADSGARARQRSGLTGRALSIPLHGLRSRVRSVPAGRATRRPTPRARPTAPRPCASSLVPSMNFNRPASADAESAVERLFAPRTFARPGHRPSRALR